MTGEGTKTRSAFKTEWASQQKAVSTMKAAHGAGGTRCPPVPTRVFVLENVGPSGTSRDESPRSGYGTVREAW